MFALLFKHFNNPEVPSPTTIYRFSLNTGPDAVLGVKHKVEKVRDCMKVLFGLRMHGVNNFIFFLLDA
jgi:hypothetical protein